MRISHFATVAPNRCGLYGTAKDLMKAEEMAGFEVGMVDTVSDTVKLFSGKPEGYPFIQPDIEVKSLEWANQSDVIIRHSFLPTEIQNKGIPLVMALHGRPESSWRLEVQSNNEVVSYVTKKARKDDRYKAFLVFWKEYLDIWGTIIPKQKMFYVPVPVDLDYYHPSYRSSIKLDGSPRILIADIWREDVTPFNMVFAAYRFQQKYCKEAKIHILALQKKDLIPMTHFLSGMGNVIGSLPGHVGNIRDYYAQADMVITPHVIATRTVREPLAMGVPVVAGSGNKYTPYSANPMDIEAFADAINECWVDYSLEKKSVKEMARKTAELSFNPKLTGDYMKSVVENIR